MMKRRWIPLIAIGTPLDRMRWVAVLYTTLIVSLWELARRWVFPELGWQVSIFTIGMTLLLGNLVSLVVTRIIRRLQLSLEERNRELQAINAIISTASLSLYLDTLTNSVLEEVAKATGMEAGLIWLPAGEKSASAKVVTRGLTPEFLGALQGGLLMRIYQAGPGMGKPLILSLSGASNPDLARELLHPQGPRALAIFPISSKALVLGILGAGTYGRTRLSKDQQSLLGVISQEIGPAIENARLYEEVRNLSIGTVRSLAAAVDARDHYTKEHSEEVAQLSVSLAKELEWEGQDLDLLEYASLLHDVGKIGVPDAVLNKPGSLTDEEWEKIYRHPETSAEIVQPVSSLERIVPWVYHHQERWDGTGYPDGLKGEEIPLASRILAVVDAYIAITSDRPYRPARSHEEAIQEIRNRSGTQFDPQIVEVFLRAMEKRRSPPPAEGQS